MARCPRCCTPVSLAPEPQEAPKADGWYYQVIGQEVGPVPFPDLQCLAQDGKISPETPVRRASGSRWLLAERVAGLFEQSDGRREWYFTHNGKKVGPITYAMLRKLILAGQLAPADLLWQRGWPKAVSVGQCLAENLLLLPASETPPLAVSQEITFTCPSCGDRYAVDKELMGKTVRCRSCHKAGQVGGSGQT
jgi:predicted Zn finger-like uncharacterized protein